MNNDGPTPPLDEWLLEYEADDNTWWRTDSGHHMNLFDAAIERMQAAEARVGELELDRTAMTIEIDDLKAEATKWKTRLVDETAGLRASLARSRSGQQARTPDERQVGLELEVGDDA